MRSRASGAARLDASFCCFCERAPALSELRLLPIRLARCSPFSDMRCRIAQKRVPTSCKASANQIVELVRSLTYIESTRLSCRGVPCSACRSRKRSTPLADPARSVNKTGRLKTGDHLLTRDSSMVPKSLLPLLPSVYILFCFLPLHSSDRPSTSL